MDLEIEMSHNEASEMFGTVASDPNLLQPLRSFPLAPLGPDSLNPSSGPLGRVNDSEVY